MVERLRREMDSRISKEMLWKFASRCQFGKVFVPDPADLVGVIVLVLREPELALFADDVEDLEGFSQYTSLPGHMQSLGPTYFVRDISQIRIPSLPPSSVDVELIHTHCKEQNI